MTDRLSALDASFLRLEDATTPMHVGSVMVFDVPDTGFDYERLVDLISERIAHVPRYRQRVRTVPLGIGPPVWVDDQSFDLSYHVRRSALPRPGSDEQLEELVARILPRPLDPLRPLWEVYLVEGLAEDRFAIITKSHHSLVDGVHGVDIGGVIVDGNPTGGEGVLATWSPRPEPTSAELVVGALADVVRTPGQLLETLQHGVADVARTAGQVAGVAADVVTTLARLSARPAPESPLNASVGRARRYVMVGTDLEDYRAVRARLGPGAAGGQVTVHDVVLATVAGAFRSWMLTRGEPVHPGTTVRALVPVSVQPADVGEEGPPGAEVTACFVDLPVGEPTPSMRLHQIAFAMRQQTEGGGRRAVPADALTGVGGFAPPTLHALGARLGRAVGKRLHNVVVTNVPGPQTPLYADGAQMVSTYPVTPLGVGQALSIGLTSYDGGVYYGIYADRDAIPDADVLGQGLLEALQELLEAPRPRSRRT
ncbi:wax ester/triacylglycerol synthase family O-acyltransferase [Phycicoccus endophyticus]|uniref:Diacylglycerol O-acyltransferase n=1 Tax=Phycicoccus endophyticus TaxID=1690220 RepID=A0A7G9R369_9MICO|nr:wax ester/triacylglycerol synthase family O-acyltransferase [Phycicoccus endophyticus]NHI19783.1 wax ester/triacylglycerol synthase family O-acyltransferase [Phycicoccus endophyticus]QNN50044.1 wax ester/triacylglycerol synthase family O-acyltransferase [Phycicoccus endophyticus]GGL28635.1 diacylglycerol O-acyltransferase [Phycicoccus endophyticus]